MKKQTAEYRAIHRWVESVLGRPMKCNRCGDNEPNARKYHWANLSGAYKKDMSDWDRMCVRCHMAYDAGRKSKDYCKRGHRLEPGNIYKRPQSVECIACRKLVKRAWDRGMAL